MGATRRLCLEPVMKHEARAFDLVHRMYLIQAPRNDGLFIVPSGRL